MANRKYVPVFFKTDPKANRVITLAPLSYKKVRVPAGYQSDGLTKLVNKYRPNCLRAAVIHDYAIDSKCITRKLADKYFYEILRLDGVNKLRAKKYYFAVSFYRIITFKK